MKARKAFTLVEVMIFLVTVAILLAVIFMALKPQQVVQERKARLRYAQAYDALNLAVYDLVTSETDNPFERQGLQVIQEGHEAEFYFNKMCTGLVKYINAESSNCSPVKVLSNSSTTKQWTYMTREDVDMRNITPQIVAVNGMKFYITRMIEAKVNKESQSRVAPTPPDFDLKFFMVYVDIDGEENSKRPHTIQYDPKKKIYPSVFAFAVIPTGEAIPIGLAEHDMTYLQTRVAYVEDHTVLYSPYYSYHRAKHAAWGVYSTALYNLKRLPPLKEKISATYNDHIKYVLVRNRSALYKFLTGDYKDDFQLYYEEPPYGKCIPTGSTLTPYDKCSINYETPNFGATN
ncbi:MAG: type II secretion system protein [Candidatus Gastranaerophilaceae bacterium]